MLLDFVVVVVVVVVVIVIVVVVVIVIVVIVVVIVVVVAQLNNLRLLETKCTSYIWNYDIDSLLSEKRDYFAVKQLL